MGAKVVSLPECFNSPYGVQYFGEYSEPIPGESTTFLSDLAKKHEIYLIGGTVPEKDGDKLYNTCTVFDPKGELILKYRKMHLFDIDVPGKITFQESKVLSPGNSLGMFDTPYCKIGVGVCYDLRFPELAQIYARRGCKLIVYPGAFNMTTGPSHWELLQRARATDNQVYVAGVSVARNETASYIAWGHSAVTDPWGSVVASTDHTEGCFVAKIDLAHLDNVRMQIPITVQRREDLYSVNFI